MLEFAGEGVFATGAMPTIRVDFTNCDSLAEAGSCPFVPMLKAVNVG